jgi:predicted small secreted protein
MKTSTRQSLAKLSLAALLAAYALSLAACNTVSGAGQDLKDASDGTKRAIQGDNKK